MNESAALQRKDGSESRPVTDNTDPKLELVKPIDNTHEDLIEIVQYQPESTDHMPEFRAGSANLSEAPFQIVGKEVYFNILDETITDLAQQYVQEKKLGDTELRTTVFYRAKQEALKRIMNLEGVRAAAEEVRAKEKNTLIYAISADLEMSRVREAIVDALSKNIQDPTTFEVEPHDRAEEPQLADVIPITRQPTARNTGGRIKQITDRFLRAVGIRK
jgi:hypothetical protein